MSATTQATPAASIPQAALLQFPSKATEQITQFDLVELMALRKDARAVQAKLEAAEAGLREKLEAGSGIEAGSYCAKIEVRERRNVSWKEVTMRLAKRLKLNPEAYCANVLEHTKPTQSRVLVIE